MPDVAQIVCPHCRNNLRIPTAWADQPMRCRFCRQVFQARRKAGASSMPEAGANDQTVALKDLAAPASPELLSPSSFPMKPVLMASLVIVGAGAAALVIGIVLGPALRNMFKPDAPPQQATAKSPNGSDTPVATEKPVPKEPGKEKSMPEPAPRPPEPTAPAPQPEQKPRDIAKAPPDQDKKLPDKSKPPPEKQKEPVVSPALTFILSELALFPPTTGGKTEPIDPATLPAFSPEVLAIYSADYMSIFQFKDKEAQTPIRAAVAKALQTLRENANSFKMRATVPGRLVDKQLFGLKNQVKAEQDVVAQKALVLKDLVKEMADAGDLSRAKATKRWQVLFDYTMLRLKSRIVYIVEYNFNLAQIRADSLPALQDDDKLYRLTPQEKVTVNEAYIKQYVKDLKKGWPALAQNHPETPWAFLAPTEQAVLLGMSWQPAKQ